jgi:hypothetical protein
MVAYDATACSTSGAMSKRSIYFRKGAAEAEEGARKATGQERARLIELARIYTHLAERFEEIDDDDT